MRFFRIRSLVSDTFHPKDTYHSQDIIGADTAGIALSLCKQEWIDSGYTYLETISCEEIYPEAVFCERSFKKGEVAQWLS